MFISLKIKIIVLHLFLVIILLGGLSYKHYKNSLSNYVQSVMGFHKNSSASIVSTASLAISGANYGNVQLPSFVEELSNNEKLLYLNIIGKSDYTSKEFNAVYDKEHQAIYRNIYPIDFQKKLQTKLDRFKESLKDPLSDKVKVNFLIQRANDALRQYNQNIKLAKELSPQYTQILPKKSPFIDFDTNQLYLSLDTSNKNGGKVSMIFDISEVVEMKNKIIQDLIIESLIALVIAIVLLNILSNQIVAPLNKLSEYMSKDCQSLNPNNIPALNLKDEIGTLSNMFKTLIEKVQAKRIETERKAYIDGLTGVYNRNKLDEIFKDEILRSQRYNNTLSIVLIDIDNFKSFNDTFGHLIGDEILIMMAQNVKIQLRENDIFARWGGEEFVILFKETSVAEAKIVSEKLRDKIQKTKHASAGSITASFGITEYIDGDTVKSILKRCDEALYRAKVNGRNRVEVF
ncbi:MAG: diguanylate cyclase [Helicobacteraceae bacterium]|nr:diguanylate cyclase [Candidatus Sulfurimonas ponti]